MKFKDYYNILGVKESADAGEIKKAFRKLARQYHPDVNSEADAEDKFKEVSEAYEVLKDAEKRAEYDQLRQMGAMGGDGQFRPPPGWESASHFSAGGFDQAGMGSFSDFFESIFGRQGTAHRSYHDGHADQMRMRGEDIHVSLPIALDDAHHGCEKIIRYRVPSYDNYGLLNHEEKTLKVKIPSGTLPGKPMRLKGQGGRGIGGGGNGDLYIDVEFAPHPVYTYEDGKLYRRLDIAPWEAALGTRASIRTLSGDLKLSIPANSQSGNLLRLKGKGFNGGDLIVELRIVMPSTISEKAKQLYEQLANESDFNPRSKEQVA